MSFRDKEGVKANPNLEFTATSLSGSSFHFPKLYIKPHPDSITNLEREAVMYSDKDAADADFLRPVSTKAKDTKREIAFTQEKKNWFRRFGDKHFQGRKTGLHAGVYAGVYGKRFVNATDISISMSSGMREVKDKIEVESSKATIEQREATMLEKSVRQAPRTFDETKRNAKFYDSSDVEAHRRIFKNREDFMNDGKVNEFLMSTAHLKISSRYQIADVERQ